MPRRKSRAAHLPPGAQAETEPGAGTKTSRTRLRQRTSHRAAQEEAAERPAAGATTRLLDDLHAWRRKCKAQERLADFASAAIPLHLTASGQGVGADDWQRGFEWLPQYVALKARRQPDRGTRSGCARLIAKILAGQLDSASGRDCGGRSGGLHRNGD